jgi:hypothetical protein
MAHIWNWIMNFTGINFGQNPFATHMYNFWSGFGGDITEFALIGTIITIYRHHVKRVNIKDIVRKVEVSEKEHRQSK